MRGNDRDGKMKVATYSVIPVKTSEALFTYRNVSLKTGIQKNDVWILKMFVIFKIFAIYILASHHCVRFLQKLVRSQK
jgi:hypothetical protein